MSSRRNGPVRRAAIRLLAEERRLPLAAAAQKYALMPRERKIALCRRILVLQQQTGGKYVSRRT